MSNYDQERIFRIMEDNGKTRLECYDVAHLSFMDRQRDQGATSGSGLRGVRTSHPLKGFP
jgi:hypothetical protein